MPSSILRLLEICPQNNDKISEAFEKLRVICNEQVNDLITTNGGQKSENIKEEQNSQEQSSAENLFAQEAKVINSKLDNEAKAINTKLDNIVSILSNTVIEVNKSELRHGRS